MSWDAGAITSAMGINISGYAQGMLQAQSIASAFPQIVTEFIADPLLAAADVARRAAEAIGEFMVESTREIGQNFGQIAAMSANLGVSTTFLSTLGRVAAMSHVEVETLAMGLKLLQQRAADALSGQDPGAAKGFADIGVGVRELQQLMADPEKLFFRVSKGLSEIANQTNKVQAANDLMGRGGFRMIGLLTQGPEKIKQLQAQFYDLGAGVNENEAAIGEKWELVTNEIEAGWTGIKKAFAAPILDAILQDSDVWVGLMKELKELATDLAAIISSVAHGTAELIRLFVPSSILQQASTVSADSAAAVGLGSNGTTNLTNSNGGSNGVVIQNLHVTGIDPDAATSQIAAKLGPEFRKAYLEQYKALDGASQQSKVARAIGGNGPSKYRPGF